MVRCITHLKFISCPLLTRTEIIFQHPTNFTHVIFNIHEHLILNIIYSCMPTQTFSINLP